MKRIEQSLKNKLGIYCLINIVNQKRYVGSSKNLQQRLLKHRSLLRKNKHENSKLQNSWNKYNEQMFEYYILEYCEEELLTQREQYYIDTLVPELNITVLVERNILSKESRLKQANTRRERISNRDIKLACKEIHQYNLQGDYLRTYSSLKEACEVNNISASSICRYIRGEYKKGSNYLWSYTKERSLLPYTKPLKNGSKNMKKVVVKDTQTNEEITFNSLNECASYFNTIYVTISNCIRKQILYKKRYMINYYTAVQ